MDHFFSFFFFAAATQGVFLAGVLGLRSKNATANKILALFIALLSVDLFQQIYYTEAFYKSTPQFISFINLFPLTYGGFLYLYTRCIAQAAPLRLRDMFHFTFFVLALFISMPWLLLSGEEKLSLFEQMADDNAPLSLKIFSLVMPLSATVYGISSFVILNRFVQAGAKEFSWLRIILVLNLLIWLLVWASIIAPLYLHHLNMTMIYFLVSVVIYMLGYFSLLKPDLFLHRTFTTSSEHNNANTNFSSSQKYGDNRLPDELREQIWSAIDAFNKEHAPWRSSNLSLSQFAESTGIASHHISQVLNDHLGLSFNDYLNESRVKAVCVELQKSNTQNLLDIALACGFSSKSSFNAIFKKQLGTTPSDYRKQFISLQKNSQH